ncbi:8576_t:CDS:1 [Dentiscutata erythropus]|uniref:8576_t:CDS:1 n=1 Tax=Dentiscutata erythropus TaxID=1348616 RepID=A0A9N8W705_9GLOM|nr:8576_t:CDS:1 [Dentiscutata erythropus]
MKLNDLTKLFQRNVDLYLKDTKEYIMLNGDMNIEPENKKVEEQQKKFKENVESFIKNFGKEASDHIEKNTNEYMKTHEGRRPSKQWEKEQRFSFVEERIGVSVQRFKENFFKRFQYEPQKHHLMKYADYGVKYLFYETWKEYHIKLSNKCKKNEIKKDNNDIISRYGYHEENSPTRQINPFKQAQMIGNEKFRQKQESTKNLFNPLRQTQQSGLDKFKQQKQDVNSVTKGTPTLPSADTSTFKQTQKRLYNDDTDELIFSALQEVPDDEVQSSQKKSILEDGKSWQEKIKETGYDPRKDPILKHFIKKLVEDGIEIPGMKGMEIIDDFL